MRFASLDIKTDYLCVCRVRRILILLSVLILKLGIEEKSEFSSLKGKIKKLVFYKLEIDKKKIIIIKIYIYIENFLSLKGMNMQVLHYISLNHFQYHFTSVHKKNWDLFFITRKMCICIQYKYRSLFLCT